MKKLISLIMALVLVLSMCFCMTACKNDDSKNDSKDADTKNVTPLTEQDIRILMEKNLDCYFLFYVAPLNNTTQQNSDGYYGTDGSYMKTYDELVKLLNATYTKDKANELLNYPSSDMPLYKNVNNSIFVYPPVITPVDYDVIWDDTYTIDMEQISATEYALTLTTYDFDSNEYTAKGNIAFENGKWRFADVIC